jgi:hypothetical protein
VVLKGSTPPAPASTEPAAAVPTRETTPVWAHTVPVAPPENTADTHDLVDDEALPALPMQKGDPDWSKTETSANGEVDKKATPEWAQTVPTEPGEPIDEAHPVEASVAEPEVAEPKAVESEAAEPLAAEPVETEPPVTKRLTTAPPPATEPPMTQPPVEVVTLTDPPRFSAADALRSTWPPASESAPAPPEETDIWPPEPPTEPAMPAWPPSSEIAKAETVDEEPSPAQPIPSWPESFDSNAGALKSEPAPTEKHPTAPTVKTPAAAPPPVASKPPPAPKAPAAKAPAAAQKPPAVSPPAVRPSPPQPPPPPPTPSAPPRPAAAMPPAAPKPEPKPAAPATRPPVEPTSGPPGRPAWAPQIPGTPDPAPDAKGDWPAPVQVPAWAPQVPLASQPGTPTWFSPKEAIPTPHVTAQPPAPKAEPPPLPPVPASGGHLPVAQIPPVPVKPPPPSAPPAGFAQPANSQAPSRPAWEVVEQHGKTDKNAKVQVGVTAEDRSYAEWFAWAKRGGAPSSACHAAAQGAFAALSTGKDLATAVQWATAAMSRAPEHVSFNRQTYCAWFALANIDLNLDQHRAHAFASAALQVLDSGQDAAAAHAAGLAAAGIR